MQSGKSNRPLQFEKVPCEGEVSVVADSSGGPMLECNYHYHPEWELTYVVSGSGRVLLGSELLSFMPGDLALIGPNVPHLYVSVPQGEGGGAVCETRVLKFGERFVDCGLFSLPEFAPVEKLFGEARAAVLWNDPGLRPGFERIVAASGAGRLLLLLELLVRLAAAPRRVLAVSGEGVPPPCSGDREQIEKAVRFMQRHFQEKLTLSAIAAVVGMEPESFRRFFRRAVRVGFSDYLVGLRLAFAGKLLRESRKSISAIAAESGFPNLSNFNRLFLARHGLTPREYRGRWEGGLPLPVSSPPLNGPSRSG